YTSEQRIAEEFSFQARGPSPIYQHSSFDALLLLSVDLPKCPKSKLECILLFYLQEASVTQKRKYIDGYINYGFTSILTDGIEKHQCVLRFKVLGNNSMRPSKLKHHLMTIHPQYAERDTDFFRRHERNIFEQPNRLYLKLQGKDRNNWQRKVKAGNVAMFENLSTVLDENEDHLLYPSLKIEITQHLKSLESELKKYFPDFEEEDGKLVRNPFSGTLDIATIPNDVQDEFLDLKNDSAAKDLYEERSLTLDTRRRNCFTKLFYPNEHRFGTSLPSDYDTSFPSDY
ncbi:SCAN domain-containing protein 3-like 20, partial [Homarus americanus]